MHDFEGLKFNHEALIEKHVSGSDASRNTFNAFRFGETLSIINSSVFRDEPDHEAMPRINARIYCTVRHVCHQHCLA